MPSDEDTTVAELRRLIAEFIRERDWDQFHDPKNLAVSLAIEASELLEHFQWVATDQSLAHALEPERLAHIREEMADVLIYLVSLADKLSVDLVRAALEKVETNRKKYPASRVSGDSRKYDEY